MNIVKHKDIFSNETHKINLDLDAYLFTPFASILAEYDNLSVLNQPHGVGGDSQAEQDLQPRHSSQEVGWKEEDIIG